MQLFGKQKPNSDEHLGLDAKKIAACLPYYKIGEKVRYNPEFKRDIVLNSIIMAYAINGHMLYSKNDFRIEETNENTFFYIQIDGKEERINKITSFYFVIPEQSGEESKLDVIRRSELGPDGPFRPRNSITLIGNMMEKGVPRMDTSVYRAILLKGGYYSNYRVVLLDLEINTLEFLERRTHYRLQIDIPVTIAFKNKTHPIACRLVDFSEESIQISFPNSDPNLEHMVLNRQLYIDIDLEQDNRHANMIGTIYRKGTDTAVIMLNKIEKNDVYTALTLLDVLDIKTALLQQLGAKADMSDLEKPNKD